MVRVLGCHRPRRPRLHPRRPHRHPRGSDLRKEFPLGTQLDAKILEIDPRRGEAKLSIRAVKEDSEKAAYQQYRAGVAREAKFGTFADLLKKSVFMLGRRVKYPVSRRQPRRRAGHGERKRQTLPGAPERHGDRRGAQNHQADAVERDHGPPVGQPHVEEGGGGCARDRGLKSGPPLKERAG